MFKLHPIMLSMSLFAASVFALLSSTPVLAQTPNKKQEQPIMELKTYQAQGVTFRAKFPRPLDFQDEMEVEQDKITYKKNTFSVSNPYLKEGDDYQIYQITIEVERPVAPALSFKGNEEKIISTLVDNFRRVYGKSYVVESLSPIEKAANGKWMVQQMSGINRVADFATIFRVYVMPRYIMRVHLYYTPKKKSKTVVDAFMKEFEVLDVKVD